MNQTIKAIIFDMDGTMVDNMAVHNRIWVDFFRELGVPLEYETFHELTAGRTSPEVLRQFLGSELSYTRLQELAEEKEVRYRAFFRQHARPVDGLLEMLQAARKAGYRLGIATAAPPRNVEFILGTLGLEGFFDAIVNGDDVIKGKPDPEIFLKAAERLGVAPDACLVFEDARMGVEAAHRAGMRAVVVTTTIPASEARIIPGVIMAIADFHQVIADLQLDNIVTP